MKSRAANTIRSIGIRSSSSPSVAVAIVAAAFVLAGCLENHEHSDGAVPAEGPEPAAEVPVERPPGATRLPARPSPSDGTQRGRWEMRLWIGLWCELPEDAVGPADFVVAVDGVPMFESTTRCPSVPVERRGAPNGGTTSFTLGEGPHVVTVIGPGDATKRFPIGVVDDTWLQVRSGIEIADGQPVTRVDTSTRALPWDFDYDPRTRPAPPIDVAGADPGTARGSARQGSGDDGEWLHAGVTSGIEPAEWAGTEPAPAGRPSREQDPSGNWIVGTPAYLVVRSARDVEVWVDGVNTGLTTPTGYIPLSGGRHRVALRDGDFERSYSVLVPAGRLRTLVNDRRW